MKCLDPHSLCVENGMTQLVCDDNPLDRLRKITIDSDGAFTALCQKEAFTGSCEGIKYKKWNCFTVQFHPEANGGPKDTEFLFDRFLNNVKAAKKEAR